MDLNTYLSLDGALSASELARAAGVRHVAQVNQWRKRIQNRQPGFEHAAAIERATEGMCTCEELNSSLQWVRIADPDWIWHPQGRPVIDPTRTLRDRSTGGDQLVQGDMGRDSCVGSEVSA